MDRVNGLSAAASNVCMIKRSLTMTGSAMDNLPEGYVKMAGQYAVPKFYVMLKLMRAGDDPAVIEEAIKADLQTIEKISLDTEAPISRVRKDFFGQLHAYREHFTGWKFADSPEDMIFKGLRSLQEKRWVGAKPKVAMLVDVSKPRKSVNNKPFRVLNLLIEPDVSGANWSFVTATLWGSSMGDVKAGEACHVIIEKNNGYTTIKEIEPADAVLPDPIPGDPRYKVMKLTASPPKTRQYIKADGTPGEFETSYLILLVQNPEEPDSSAVMEGSTTFAQRWKEAPNDAVLSTIITSTETEKGTFWNVGDWQPVPGMKSLSWPALDTLINYGPEIIAAHEGEYVILDGTPTSILLKDGAKISFYVIGLQNPLSGDETTLMLKEDAYVEGGVIEVIEGRPYFLCNRVKILTRISSYEDNQGKKRISKQALAVWNMDSVLPDLPEGLGIEEEGEALVDVPPELTRDPEPQEAMAPVAQKVIEPLVQVAAAPEIQESLPEEAPITTVQDLLKPEARTEIRPAQEEAVKAGILTQEEAKATSAILNAPAPKAAPKKGGASLFGKKEKAPAAAHAVAPAEKGEITSSDKDKIAGLRQKIAAQRAAAETPL